MLTFLLWNLNRKRPSVELARLVARHNVDILILLESGYRSPGDVLQLLNETADPIFHLPPSDVKSTFVFTRFSRQFTTPVHEVARLTIRRIALPAREEFLLAAIHFPSKLWMEARRSNAVISRGLSSRQKQWLVTPGLCSWGISI